MIRALIFDFDGLILDTETPEFDALHDIFAGYGIDLPIALYLRAIGSTYQDSGFVPCKHLMEQAGVTVDCEELERESYRRRIAIIDRQPIMPGVMNHITTARERGLQLAIGSSSDSGWVNRHLSRLGIDDCFDAIATRDDVTGAVKPRPDVFLKVLDKLGIDAEEAVVYEDSAHGITAAKAAGIFAVAVPNALTRHADLSHADLQIASLADVPLADILHAAENGALQSDQTDL